ncbi:Galactoside O-acetyltransferase [Vibrio stylophorae]|uniref:Acetyltransferase n=1 Tax=Vibrio stylophorae TaxID=659351 RepID=A0ABN8DYZ1_9VIBR|nr:sugar O-acetyltransferase [Vibrio stylophorae]CAH0535628.1 Galactoside O-acetyltransferase [Vibrio stylophorae]
MSDEAKKVDKRHSQNVYDCGDAALIQEQQNCLELLYDFNQTRPSQVEFRQQLMERIFASVGKDCYIEPPLRANWGKHTHLGHCVYANFNLTLVDDTHVYIGDHVMIGPNVTLATAGHPIEPSLRQQITQFNLPIHIGNNVWIGGHSIVLPGITIGENSVIGAGSVVTKDIPANVVAVGNPCRVLREINDYDRQFFAKGRAYDAEMQAKMNALAMVETE